MLFFIVDSVRSVWSTQHQHGKWLFIHLLIATTTVRATGMAAIEKHKHLHAAPPSALEQRSVKVKPIGQAVRFILLLGLAVCAIIWLKEVVLIKRICRQAAIKQQKRSRQTPNDPGQISYAHARKEALKNDPREPAEQHPNPICLSAQDALLYYISEGAPRQASNSGEALLEQNANQMVEQGLKRDVEAVKRLVAYYGATIPTTYYKAASLMLTRFKNPHQIPLIELLAQQLPNSSILEIHLDLLEKDWLIDQPEPLSGESSRSKKWYQQALPYLKTPLISKRSKIKASIPYTRYILNLRSAPPRDKQKQHYKQFLDELKAQEKDPALIAILWTYAHSAYTEYAEKEIVGAPTIYEQLLKTHAIEIAQSTREEALAGKISQWKEANAVTTQMRDELRLLSSTLPQQVVVELTIRFIQIDFNAQKRISVALAKELFKQIDRVGKWAIFVNLIPDFRDPLPEVETQPNWQDLLRHLFKNMDRVARADALIQSCIWGHLTLVKDFTPQVDLHDSFTPRDLKRLRGEGHSSKDEGVGGSTQEESRSRYNLYNLALLEAARWGHGAILSYLTTCPTKPAVGIELTPKDLNEAVVKNTQIATMLHIGYDKYERHGIRNQISSRQINNDQVANAAAMVWLIKHGAEVNLQFERRGDKDLILYWAFDAGYGGVSLAPYHTSYQALFQALVTQGANLDLIDSKNILLVCPLLIRAYQSGHLKAILQQPELLDRINLQVKDALYRTLYNYIEDKKDRDTLAYLKELAAQQQSRPKIPEVRLAHWKSVTDRLKKVESALDESHRIDQLLMEVDDLNKPLI